MEEWLLGCGYFVMTIGNKIHWATRVWLAKTGQDNASGLQMLFDR